MEHDVAPAPVQVLADLDALPFVVEGAGVRDEHLAGGGGIHHSQARAEAHLEFLDERKLHPADEPDLPGASQLASERAGEKAAFVLAEHHRAHVGQGDRLARVVEHGAVDEQEFRARIVPSHLARGRLHHEPDRDDQLRALVDEEPQVGLVVLLRLALQHDRPGDA